MNRLVGYIFPLALLLGCTYGDTISIETTPISNRQYPPPNPNPVEILFRDNNLKITRPYEQICRIEVKGAPGSAGSELVEAMRKKAGELGADAVIDVTQSDIDRERGVALLELLDSSEQEPDRYQTISLVGIAIRYE